MPSSRPQVLIIDDQMESIALLLQFFRGQAIDVMVALDGEEGVRKAQIGQPNIVLLDVCMPGLSGYDVCRTLKRDPGTARIPVIFLSAAADVESRLEGFAAGGADYICKPFSAEEVLARVFVHFKISRELARLGDDREAQEQKLSREVRIVTEALAIMQDSTQPWQGSEALSRRLGVNEKKLNELFRRQFGMTASEYQLSQRLEDARWKLANSPLQIQLIAREAGYNNASDFSRAFKSRYGLGPRQYRQARASSPAPVARPQPLMTLPRSA